MTVPIQPVAPHAVTAAETRLGLRVSVWSAGAIDVFDEAGRRVCRMDIPGGTQPRIAISPDGSRLAWPKNEGGWSRLRLGDTTSGKPTVVCEGHREDIWSFTFSPDGTRVATGGEDRTARLWDPATGAILATCRGHTSKVLGVAFSPDAARVVTTSSDGTVRQWDATTGREVEPPYDRHSGEVTTAVYSPDGHWIASAATDQTVRVWQARGRHDVAVLHGHKGAVTGLAFAPDGRRLASLSRASMLSVAGDDTIRVWDVDPRATLPILRGHASYVYPVAYSSDGRWIASGGWDHALRLWDAATGELCANLSHVGIVPSLAFSPDRLRLLSGSYADGRLLIWGRAYGTPRQRNPGSPRNLPSCDRQSGRTESGRDGVRPAKQQASRTRLRPRVRRVVVRGRRLGSGLQPRWLLPGCPGRGSEDRAPSGCAGLTSQLSDFGATSSSSTRPPSVSTAAASPHAVETAQSVCGRSRVASARCYAATVTRSLPWRSTPTAVAWRRLAATGPSGSGTWRGARRWRGCQAIRTMSGRSPSGPMELRWRPARETSRSASGIQRRSRHRLPGPSRGRGPATRGRTTGEGVVAAEDRPCRRRGSSPNRRSAERAAAPRGPACRAAEGGVVGSRPCRPVVTCLRLPTSKAEKQLCTVGR